MVGNHIPLLQSLIPSEMATDILASIYNGGKWRHRPPNLNLCQSSGVMTFHLSGLHFETRTPIILLAVNESNFIHLLCFVLFFVTLYR